LVKARIELVPPSGKKKAVGAPGSGGYDAKATKALRRRFTSVPVVVRVYVTEGKNFVRTKGATVQPKLVVRMGDEKVEAVSARPSRPSNPQIFLGLEVKGVRLPETSVVHIDVFDESNKDVFGYPSFVGSVSVDLLTRWLTPEWQDMRVKGMENLLLKHPTSLAGQGTLECWIDILPKAEARLHPLLKIAPPPPAPFTVRLAVWNVKDVAFLDDNMSDVLVTCRINSGESQSSDVHYRCDGLAMFNWRFVFPVELPMPRGAPEARIIIQLWDKDVLNADDSIAELSVSLDGLFRQVVASASRNVRVRKQDLPMTHPSRPGIQGTCEIEMEILSREEEGSKPAARGREDPNRYPHLPDPDRPETAFGFWRVDKYFQHMVWKKYKWYLLVFVAAVLTLGLLL